MEYTHVCEDCGDEYFEPLFTTCLLCHGELLEQTTLDLEESA